MKPDLPASCREHASGRVVAVERHFENGQVSREKATFLCGCNATVWEFAGVDLGTHWRLDETIFWKEGQA